MFRYKDMLVIDNPNIWYKASRLARDKTFGLGLGYREYNKVVLYNACLLYEGDLMNCLGALNSAMKYPGRIKIDISRVYDYKTYPDENRLMNLVRGKGFSNIRTVANWILAEK